MEPETTPNEIIEVKNVPNVPTTPQLRDHLKDDEILIIKNALDNIKSIEMYIAHDYILYGNTVCLISAISWLYSCLILFGHIQGSIISFSFCFIYLLFFYRLFYTSKLRFKSLIDFRSIVVNCFGEQNFINQLNEVEKDSKKQGE